MFLSKARAWSDPLTRKLIVSIFLPHPRYYAFDDDAVKSHNTAWDERGKRDESKRCRRISDHRLNVNNCNAVHEVALLENHLKYLGQVCSTVHGSEKAAFNDETTPSSHLFVLRNGFLLVRELIDKFL
jgi:hypothetical protein